MKSKNTIEKHINFLREFIFDNYNNSDPKIIELVNKAYAMETALYYTINTTGSTPSSIIRNKMNLGMYRQKLSRNT